MAIFTAIKTCQNVNIYDLELVCFIKNQIRQLERFGNNHISKNALAIYVLVYKFIR